MKIELHLHTRYVSSCGQLTAEEIVEGYHQAGYSGLVVTDHFNRDTFQMLGLDTKADIDHLKAYLDGYEKVKQCAKKYGMKVYRGAEVRFDGSWNDYLLYGYSDELLHDPEKIFTEGVEAFYKRCRAEGALLVHAHPYRNGGMPTTPKALDGVEVCNMHPGHNNRNELALAFARENGLLEIAGSDCHEKCHIGRGGILVEQLPANEKELVTLLRAKNYRLFRKE